MRNENYPRRSRKQQSFRRGPHQAGRNADAKHKKGHSMRDLQIFTAKNIGPLKIPRHAKGTFQLKDVFGRNRLPLSHSLRGYPDDTRNIASAICGALDCGQPLKIEVRFHGRD